MGETMNVLGIVLLAVLALSVPAFAQETAANSAAGAAAASAQSAPAPALAANAAQTAPAPAPSTTPAAPATPHFDVIRLRGGTVLAGEIIGYGSDSIVMKVFGVERAYKIGAIEDLKFTSAEPEFLKAVMGAALRNNNIALAIIVGQRDKDLTKTVLGYPKFMETIEELKRANAALDALSTGQADAHDQLDTTQGQIDDLQRAITQSQQVIANPYYYETAPVTHMVPCTTCNGSGFIRFIPFDAHGWGEGDRRERDRDRDHDRDRAVRVCPTCNGTGTLSATVIEQVQRTRDVNAEAAKLIALRAEQERLTKASTKLEKTIAGSDAQFKAARDAAADASARLQRLCAEIVQKYFPDRPADE